MHPDDAIFVILFFMILWGFIVVITHVTQRHKRWEMQHKERMAALERGLPAFERAQTGSTEWTPRVYLLRGMIWLFSGIALVAGSLLVLFGLHEKLAFGIVFCIFGFVPVGVGVAYLVFYSSEVENKQMVPPRQFRK